jgi:hypothetical protein
MIKNTILSSLATQHGTDKWNHHYYTDIYHHYLQHLKNSSIKLLEIGVGGYEYPDRGGQSLKMWKDYFPHGQIWAIDIYDKSKLQEDRIAILQGSQNDADFLQEVFNRMGGLHVVVDDGSHKCSDVIASFQKLFPLLDENGIYIIEDTETSYWESYGGSFDLNNPCTTKNFFISLLHGLDHITIPNFPVSYFTKNIKGMSFYRNLIIVQKGEPK